MSIHTDSLTFVDWMMQMRWPIHRWTPAATQSAQAKKRRLAAALTKVYHCFASEQPNDAHALFDEHFLQHAAAPLFAGYLESDHPTVLWPTGSDLALAWSRQFSPLALDPATGRLTPTNCWQRMTAFIPTATRFLQAVEQELWPMGAQKVSAEYPFVPLTVDVQYQAQPQPTVRLQLHGALYAASYRHLLAWASAVYDSGVKQLVLDLHDLQRIELSGFYVLHAIGRLFHNRGLPEEESTRQLRRMVEENVAAGLHSQVTLLNPSPAIAAQLTAYWLDHAFPICNSSY